MRLEWKEVYSVGVKEIDGQHQKIFTLLNKLNDAFATKNQGNDYEAIIMEMIDYADYHFSTEEKYFDKFQYPERDTHKSQHDEYKNKVFDFHRRLIEKGDADNLLLDLLNFVEDWWIYHINEIDKKYTKYFNDHDLY